MDELVSQYFTFHLGFPVRLLYIGGSGQREIPGSVYMPKHYSALSVSVNDKFQPQRLRFADAAPLLLTTTASEEDARRRLPLAARAEDVIIRFRPNVHVDTGDEQEPYGEDGWSMLAIRSQTDREQEVSVRCLFRTVRCLSLNADLTKGGMIATNRQLYGLLAKDRRVNEKFPSKSSTYLLLLSSKPTPAAGSRRGRAGLLREDGWYSSQSNSDHTTRQTRLRAIRLRRPFGRRPTRRRRSRSHRAHQPEQHPFAESHHTSNIKWSDHAYLILNWRRNFELSVNRCNETVRMRTAV